MVASDVLKDFYEYSIAERLDHILFISSENKVFQGIREQNQDNWQIVELCREIIFENVKAIEYYMEGIENDRNEIKKLNWICWRR